MSNDVTTTLHLHWTDMDRLQHRRLARLDDAELAAALVSLFRDVRLVRIAWPHDKAALELTVDSKTLDRAKCTPEQLAEYDRLCHGCGRPWPLRGETIPHEAT